MVLKASWHTRHPSTFLASLAPLAHLAPFASSRCLRSHADSRFATRIFALDRRFFAEPPFCARFRAPRRVPNVRRAAAPGCPDYCRLLACTHGCVHTSMPTRTPTRTFAHKAMRELALREPSTTRFRRCRLCTAASLVGKGGEPHPECPRSSWPASTSFSSSSSTQAASSPLR